MSRPFSIALTGGIGSGKSTLAALLAEQGAALLDLDAIGRELTVPGGAGHAAIVGAFGAQFAGPDGRLDRALIRARAFGDDGFRHRLEALLHPLIWRRADELATARATDAEYLLFDVPLLGASSAQRGRFDRVLVIDCPVHEQVARVLQRSGLQRSEAEAIIAAQPSRAARLAMADDIVFNGADHGALAQRALRLHAAYRAFGLRRVSV